MQGWECKTTNSAFQLKCADTAQPCCYSGDIAHAGVNQDCAFQMRTYFSARKPARDDAEM
ncbi:hypothetical protein [Paraburkholderia xenovorans]|jgi:hypothetical protein|uniref:hypothetical protein n=1 Tax=Paraburkholderia xenovorans TaxID=36873 RepID=UPI0011D0D971|nr:hypothetical protein [Paraburkholderia xenovorans]